MKKLARSPAVQGTLAFLFASYLNLCLATMRWTREDMPKVEAVWAAGGGVIVCFWHGRIGLSPACWERDRAQEPRALISLSADGQFIASAMERIGFPAIRGSAAAAVRMRLASRARVRMDVMDGAVGRLRGTGVQVGMQH